MFIMWLMIRVFIPSGIVMFVSVLVIVAVDCLTNIIQCSTYILILSNNMHDMAYIYNHIFLETMRIMSILKAPTSNSATAEADELRSKMLSFSMLNLGAFSSLHATRCCSSNF